MAQGETQPATGGAQKTESAVTAAPARDVVISVKDLVLRFDSDEGPPVTVLNGITFDVYRGETLVIMGGSGCGKSTLLNCMIGELEFDRGTIEFNLPQIGKVVLPQADTAARDKLRKRFGILFQSGALYSSMSVGENIALLLREHSHVDEAIIDIVVAMKLQQVNMLPHRDKSPSQLSGGQQKRVGLARATALDPEIIFYDEPSAGLDPVTSSTIDELMMDLAKKLHVTSVVVTHEMDSAFRIADRMIMLDRGKILRAGRREEFEKLRDQDPSTLKSPAEQLLHQFLNGAAHGPLTDSDALALYEKVLAGKDENTAT